MTSLVWDLPEERQYQNGVDRGAIFFDDKPGVPWNGLTSVAENFVGGERSKVFYDGVKVADAVNGRFFQATVKAYSFPDSCRECLGDAPLRPGVILTKQPRRKFHLTYRTRVSGDVGYKIHLVYNAVLMRTKQTYSTQNATGVATLLEWKLDASPPQMDRSQPSAHMFVDSTKCDPTNLAIFEDLLYGTILTNSDFPTPETVYRTFNL